MSNVSLNIGLQALLTSQSALDTIGNNIANANTPGYSRQSLSVSTNRSIGIRNLQIGQGVSPDRVVRTVDDLLNRRIISQLGVLSRLDARYEGMSQAETLFGEPGDFGLGTRIDELFGGLSALSTNPEDLVLRTGAVQAAEGMASQFNQLSANLATLRTDLTSQVDSLATEVNANAQRVADLNREIMQTEVGGVVANDLRDERDRVLQELGQQVDVTFQEGQRGEMRVFIGGQILVGSSVVNGVQAAINPAGDLELTLDGGTRPVQPTGGRMSGLQAVARDFIPRLEAELDQLARAIALEMNRSHSTGVPQAGGFTRLTSDFAVEDTDSNGTVANELLTAASLPFDITSGSLTINVRSTADGSYTTHTLDIDTERTTVGDFVADINAIPGVSASIDGNGKLQMFADGGLTFDFGARLQASPNASGTFGGAQASLGTGMQEPFALFPGATLDITGPVGPFTVNFGIGSFNDITQATAEEVAAALNADPGLVSNGLRAVASDDQVFIQTLATGPSASFAVTGGTGLGGLGLGAAVAGGSTTAVDVQVTGSYSGDANERWTFRPSGDGEIGTTPGLTVDVLDTSGQVVAQLDVGPGYTPGNPLEVRDGVNVSFSFGELSATANDAFQLDLVADSDTSDVLVAFGLNSLFTGTDAESLAVRKDLSEDPRLLALSSTGELGDNGALLDLLDAQQRSAEGLDGTFNQFYGNMIGSIGFEISSTESASEVEQFLFESLEARRDQVSGVNVDEELVNMIQYEQAFGAAARFIDVVNTINDTVLSLI